MIINLQSMPAKHSYHLLMNDRIGRSIDIPHMCRAVVLIEQLRAEISNL
jgi:hypothetical protein